MTTKTVRVDEIEVSSLLQMRANEPPCEEYEEILRKRRAEWPFPPLRCIQVGERLLLVGGFTRLRAALKAGRKEVPVEITKGAWKDAIAEACGENEDHGFRRTVADRRKAIIRAQEEGVTSPTAIAKICRLSRTTVYQVLGAEKPTLPGVPDKPKAKPKAKAEEAEPSPPSRALSTAPAKASHVARSGEPVEDCPVCGEKDWTATDAGYVCGTCQYDHGEVAAADDAERIDAAGRRALIEDGVAADVVKANSDYGRLLRSLRCAGLHDSCERAMLSIHKKIQEALRAKARR